MFVSGHPLFRVHPDTMDFLEPGGDVPHPGQSPENLINALAVLIAVLHQDFMHPSRLGRDPILIL